MKILKKVTRYIVKHISPEISALLAKKETLQYFENTNLVNNYIFSPTIDWDYPLKQRPQYLAEALSKCFVNVTYCTCNYEWDHYYGLCKLDNNLYIYNNFKLAAHKLKNNILYLTSSQSFLNIEQIAYYKKIGYFIVYDYVDEISGEINFSDYNTTKNMHLKILSLRYADLVVCVSKRLCDEVTEYYPKDRILYLPNAVNPAVFSLSKKIIPNIPDEMKNVVKLGKKVIGYYGAIASWLDFDLLNSYISKHKEYSFVFIGSDYNNALKNLSINQDNLYYFGEKKFSDLPKYSFYFDVAIIPFKRGNIAKATSPLKVYEYMLMAKTVVATEDLHECYSLPGVFISKNDIDSFDIAINKALQAYDDVDLVRSIRKAAKDNNWNVRAQQLIKRVTSLRQDID